MGEYILSDSTSSFNQQDITKLCINIVGGEIFHGQEQGNIPNLFYVGGLKSDEIRGYETHFKVEDKSSRTLCKHLVRIMDNEKLAIGTSESHTDGLVNYLLKKLELDEDPWFLNIKPIYKFEVGNKTITSIPEFSVEKNDLTVFIDEDKHFNNLNAAKRWGEFQIAGECLAAIYTNYNNIFKYEHTPKKRKTTSEFVMYALRVIGTRFTFYKMVVTHKYLLSLSNGLPLNESCTMYRYPDNNNDFTSCYSYLDPKERKMIIESLFNLKNI